MSPWRQVVLWPKTPHSTKKEDLIHVASEVGVGEDVAIEEPMSASPDDLPGFS